MTGYGADDAVCRIRERSRSGSFRVKAIIMAPRTATLLIARDIGATWGRQQAEELARSIELRLKQSVILCWPDDSAATFLESIQSLCDAGIQRVVVCPLGLLPVPATGAIPLLLARAARQWSALSFHAAPPLSWLDWAGWLQCTAIETLASIGTPPESAAVLLLGRGSTNVLDNGDLARLAQFLRNGPFAFVEHAFITEARPSISEAVGHMVEGPVKTAVVVPWRQASDDNLLQCQVAVTAATQGTGITAQVVAPRLAQASLVNLLVSNHLSALADRPLQFESDSSVATTSQQAGMGSIDSGLSAEEAFELQQMQQRINAMLPFEYQGRFEDVSPKSMGSAGLKYDSDGNVAWDQIWTSFCDLALAGGPPHRGKLLEAVTAADALADEDNYQAVVAEIERGIRLVTSLPIVTSSVAGWVGVRCDSEQMAVWLMRAIIVENIMVRREAEVLYLPAGPQFTLKREIKNVITAIAKTTHYWKAHLLTRRRSEESQ